MFDDASHRRGMLALIVVALLATTACNSERTTDNVPRNAAVINVVANTSLTAWLTDAAAKFNQSATKTSAGKTAFVKLSFAEAGKTIADSAKPLDAPDLWIPDDAAWVDLLATKGNTNYKADCVSVAQSPLVIAMWRPLAESLGWPTRKLGWLDISSLASDEAAWRYYSGGQYGRTLRLAHAHPGLSGSGANTLLAVMQAAKQSEAPLTEDEIKSPIIQASLNAFESGVTLFGASPNQLAQAMRARGIQYLGATAMYENNVMEIASGDPEIVPIYPFEGTFVATHPACVNGAAQAEQSEGAKLFRDYLLKPEAQAGLQQYSLRPASGPAKLNAPLDAAQPKIIFKSSSAQAIQALQSSWQTARKPMHLVLVMDISGSMAGSKINGLKAAAKQFVAQMNDNDYLTLMPFSSAPYTELTFGRVADSREEALSVIDGLHAEGGTALYDAIAAASQEVADANSKQRSNLIVVLSDGLDTSSGRRFSSQLIEQATENNTSLYTIAYGGDADKKVLSSIATQSNGAFYTGNEADIAAIYQEMSTAFGGNVGIGR